MVPRHQHLESELFAAPASSGQAPRRAHPLRDRISRFIGVPLLGFIIPRISGIFDDVTARSPAYWLGTFWFFFLSFVVWQSNRTLHFHLRSRLAHLHRPAWRLAVLMTTNVLCTTPISAAMFVAWYLCAPVPSVDWPAVIRATALTAGAVLVVSHAYETAFLIHELRADRTQMASTERARWQAELANLKDQLAPHFLFNCLNTLSVLIAEEPRIARKFNQHLANLCRYLLKHKEHDLVPLAAELAFFKDYLELVQLRHHDALQVRFRGLERAHGQQLPPASLQLLLENALNHNTCTPAQPLVIEITLEGGLLTVANRINTPLQPTHGTGIGLKNLGDRFALLTGQEIDVQRDGETFRVKLPLIPSA